MKLIKYYFPIENDYKVDLPIENDYKVDLEANQLSKQVIVQIVLPLNTSLLIVRVIKNRVLNELFALTYELPQINLNKE